MLWERFTTEIVPGTDKLLPITIPKSFINREISNRSAHTAFYICTVDRHTSPFLLSNLFGLAHVASLRGERRLLALSCRSQWVVYRLGRWFRKIVFWAFEVSFHLGLIGIDYESRSSIASMHGQNIV
jgi:hypothetical protein